MPPAAVKLTEEKTPLHAVIIAEPFTTMRNPVLFPLSPITPSADLPYALLPICNTPIIDYILENLVENAVNQVTILVDGLSEAMVLSYLQEHRTARGKPWLFSDAISVRLCTSGRPITQLSDAAQEIVEQNLVSAHHSFLFVPIDCVAFIPDLRGAFATHLARVAADPSYTATLLCTSDCDALHETLHNVLVGELLQREEGSAAQRGGLERMETTLPDDGFSAVEYAKYRNYAVPAVPRSSHTMLHIDLASQTVVSMTQLRAEAGPAASTQVNFHQKKRQSVRMDLQPTGFLFCTAEAVPLIEFHIVDVYNFLSAGLLGTVEISGKHFGVLELPHTAVVEPISGLEAYLAANLNVCARRLFPFTRESCFADPQASYAVSYGCDTVYQHTTAKVADQLSGPHVVVGPAVHLTAVDLVGTVCGADVTIGEGSTLTSCVLLDRAVVGRGCVLRGCVVGQGAVIGDNVVVVNSIIGHGCVVRAGGGGPRLVVHHQAIMDCDAGDRNVALVGAEGHGREIAVPWANPCLPTTTLFTEDPQPAAEENHIEEDPMEAFRHRIWVYMEKGLLNPSNISACKYDMSTACLNYSCNHADLCEVVTELLVEHALKRHGDDVPAALEAIRVLFGTWCRPFYNQYVTERDGKDRLEPMLGALEGSARPSTEKTARCTTAAHDS
ncbi:translation initiation factor eIF-2B subunit epsilon [Strigomonas culicis]|uniref:Translation initiation factor eIF-2B subunit epsilon n=1 Tax=Strigomonas culicis TaxID=28005 RepID=S9TWG7_9TRYP|nr:translation initiation factor eIF-2B subunit epsilon [Strigomonas culicis]|eukprot:EPY20948.1 translation initiation factor eIF-2B subunit epsilon [Strigomonas culicis]